MTIKEFITQAGGAYVADQLGISRQAVHEWGEGTVTPRPEFALKLIHISGGLITWHDIFQPFAESKLKGETFSWVSKSGASHQVKF